MRRYCVGASRSWQEDWNIADAAPLPPFSFLVFTFHSYTIPLARSVLIRSYAWFKTSSHPLHLLNKLPRILRMSGPKFIQPSIQPLSRIRHRLHLSLQPLRDLLISPVPPFRRATAARRYRPRPGDGTAGHALRRTDQRARSGI